MAEVFLATDTRTNSRVALRLVATRTRQEADGTLEAERWGAKLQEQFCLASPHVPRVYEHGTRTATSISRWNTSKGRTSPR